MKLILTEIFKQLIFDGKIKFFGITLVGDILFTIIKKDMEITIILLIFLPLFALWIDYIKKNKYFTETFLHFYVEKFGKNFKVIISTDIKHKKNIRFINLVHDAQHISEYNLSPDISIMVPFKKQINTKYLITISSEETQKKFCNFYTQTEWKDEAGFLLKLRGVDLSNAEGLYKIEIEEDKEH